MGIFVYVSVCIRYADGADCGGGIVGAIGIMTAAMMYTSTPGIKPVNVTMRTQMRRSTVESMAEYSAIPPQTPVSSLSVELRYNFL